MRKRKQQILRANTSTIENLEGKKQKTKTNTLLTEAAIATTLIKSTSSKKIVNFFVKILS